jgi:hypothetical protein
VAPEVRAAFLAEPGRPVALHVYEWSGRQQHAVRQEWVLVTGQEVLDDVAAGLLAQGRSYSEFPTAIGFAMGFGALALSRGPACAQKTLDVAGDGTNNDGFSPDIARREFDFDGVIVNGLVVGESRETLKRYYEQYVIQGPGSFVEVAEDYRDFERAMRRKLLRELGTGAVSGLAR